MLNICISWASAGMWDQIHNWSGYVLFLLLSLRIVLAITCKHPNANGKIMLKKLIKLPIYLKQITQKKFHKTRGLSSLGVVTVLFLIGLVFLVNATGLMLTFEDYVGDPWLESMHAELFDYTLVMLATHVLGVIFFSLKQKENKFKAMIFGDNK